METVMGIKFNLNTQPLPTPLTEQNTPLCFPLLLRNSKGSEIIAIRIKDGTDCVGYQFITFSENSNVIGRAFFMSLAEHYSLVRPLKSTESFMIPGMA